MGLRMGMCLGLFVGALVLFACEQSVTEIQDPWVQAPETVDSLPPSDIKVEQGRKFVYLDPQGNIHHTNNYNTIPLDRRSAVIVLNGPKRGRVKQAADGKLKIEALPPLIRAAADAGLGSDAGQESDANLEAFRKMLKAELHRMDAASPQSK